MLTTPDPFFTLLSQCHLAIHPAFLACLIITVFTGDQHIWNHTQGKTTCIKNSQTTAGSIEEPFDYMLYARQDPNMNAINMRIRKLFRHLSAR
jgi:hypothetical protein